ncbi:hypothetical protein ACHAXA_011237 [Cyclostephanos tholiformis]|uniref:Choline transporter-like protein n=1 Tax=Cyclostephanos tholiformis TaxID=382380 RepID=A0ABD3SQ54_9STRA
MKIVPVEAESYARMDVQTPGSGTPSNSHTRYENETQQTMEPVLDEVEAYARMGNDAQDDVSYSSSSSSLGSLWMKKIRGSKTRSSNGKKVSKANKLQLNLTSACRMSFDDEEVSATESLEYFAWQNHQEQILDRNARKLGDGLLVFFFLFHLGVVILLSVMGTASGYGDITYLIIECAMFASATSVGIFALMVRYPGKWLRSSLTLSLSFILGVLVVTFLREESAPCITLLIIFVMSLLYCAYSWKRLTFVGSCFYTSVSVIESNTALYTAAFLLQLAAVVWCIVWILACTFVIKATGPWFVLPFLISYFWRILRKSCTSLFGSICFGSLFVNYFLCLRKLPKSEKYEKIAWLKYVHDASIYMNKWGFVYVGLYEFPFFQAGKYVSILFENRNWSELIADDLADNILLIINLAVATSTGAFAWILSTGKNHYYLIQGLSYYYPYTAGFFVGFFAGFLISSIMISVFGGVANAIVVCFAERPRALKESHPDQFKMLLRDWSLELPKGIKKPKTNKKMADDSFKDGLMADIIGTHEQVNGIIIDIIGEPDGEERDHRLH